MKTKRLFVGYNPRTRVEFERLNLVARYAGVPRAEFVRQSVAFMDSTLMLDALAQQEKRDGALSAEHLAMRAEVIGNMDAVLTHLRPVPMPTEAVPQPAMN